MSSQFIRSALLVAILGFAACSDGPTDAVAPDPPGCLEAESWHNSTDTLAQFQWCAPTDESGITGYRVWWSQAPVTSTSERIDSFDIDAVHHSQWVGPISKGRKYHLSVAARRGDLFSQPASIDWGL